MPNVKRVYTFGNKKAEGNGKMRELLGGKGANLAEMNLVGIPVPPGFTITTEVCTEYYQHGKEEVIKMIKPEVEAAMKQVEKNMGMEFGSSTNPLLLSVRSGARASMPGMMDTILNLGLNDEAVEGIAKKTGNARFDELDQVLKHGGVNRIMLDNFSVPDTKKAVDIIAGKYETESSGGTHVFLWRTAFTCSS